MSALVADFLRRTPFGWWDLLDIAIVSILIYEFLKLIRGTRAVQMAVGSLLIIGLFYVSRLAPLQTLNWMIRNALLYVAFAAIVIFQSDIRRALAHFGQAPFFRYFTRQAADETIEELVVAATVLSAHKTGAIMAVEREIGLRNYIESGIPVDATLTYDLLVTIFQPGSPLHDGAVIIQEARIAAAACFLPLTVNPRVSRELGTRHRAAIGLTEEGDAVAVVVSEETGQIGLALDGHIERGLTADQLRESFGQFVPLGEHADLGVDLKRAGVDVRRADERLLTVDDDGLRVQPEGCRRDGRRDVFGQRFSIGPQLVELDARRQDVAPPAFVAGVSDHVVVGRERVRHDGHAHAARHDLP